MNVKFLATAALLATATSANAFYVEGQLGKHSTDVDTQSYSGTAAGLTYSGLKGSIDYDIDPALGIEIGASVAEGVRVGASYTELNVDMESITVSVGSVTDGTTTYNSASGTVTRSQIADLSSSAASTFDNNVKLLMVNAYYDFAIDGDFKPFLGAGIGKADISNAKSKETAMSFYAGMKYDIDDSMYVGAKYSRTSINGPTDQNDINFEDIDVDSFYIMVGKSF